MTNGAFLLNCAMIECCTFVLMMRFSFLKRLFLPVLLLAGCSSYEAPENGMDCGRQFINATYQGNFKRAKQLLVPGEGNEQLLSTRFEQPFRSLDGFGKERLSQSSIHIKSVQQQGDSVVLLTYQNAYDNKVYTLKCQLQEGNWKTDLAYSFR